MAGFSVADRRTITLWDLADVFVSVAVVDPARCGSCIGGRLCLLRAGDGLFPILALVVGPPVESG
jgi:hypothetical protein